jgi:hypothetical protein
MAELTELHKLAESFLLCVWRFASLASGFTAMLARLRGDLFSVQYSFRGQFIQGPV